MTLADQTIINHDSEQPMISEFSEKIQMNKCATDLKHRYLSALDMNGSIEEDHLAKKLSTADGNGPALLGLEWTLLATAVLLLVKRDENKNC
jgi:hypothetical protein